MMGELIDRDELLEVLGDHVTSVSVCAIAAEARARTEMKNICIEDVQNAPAIDAVPVVHGRWVKMTGMMPPEYQGHYECSECQWHLKGLRNSWTREEELSYCPNCGSRMDA